MRGQTLRAAFSAILLVVIGNVAQAQNFPSRPVTLIVPWSAGGATDIAMRALAAATEPYLGLPIVIKNRPGASGALGSMDMAAAKPDGYVIAQIPISLLRVAFLRETTFDPATDLTYIIGLTGYTFGVVVRNDAPWKTFQELLADAKAHPGKISYGTAGAGTTPHLTMMEIAHRQGIDWLHIPFKGSADVMAAILGGQIDVAADGSTWAAMVNSGKLRLLVTWGRNRTEQWPNVATLKEDGIDLVSEAPYGIAGPKGMDPDIVKALHDAFRKGMAEPKYVEVLRRLEQKPFYLNSQDYRAFAIHQIAEQKRLIEDLRLNPNQH
jgi:tripartite-type tricarboxylate transporter receptor subunit TctC